MGTPIITLRQYLEKTGENGRFVIPDYQRGYIWGQANLRDKKKEDSVNYMLNSLLTTVQTPLKCTGLDRPQR